MIQKRAARERGHTVLDWLDSHHTFSFDQYYDPQHSGFHTLRVINEDRVKSGQGFEPHSHRDMEIITYVLEGSLEHRDSLGNGSIIRPGDIQRMSAGTGITHSEFNPSEKEPVHLLQIWILPEKKGLAPSYEQKNFADRKRTNEWILLASKTPDPECVLIHQDVKLSAAFLSPSHSLSYPLPPDRRAWIQILRGKGKMGGLTLTAGDGVAVTKEKSIEFTAVSESELLLFDLGNLL